MRGLSVVFTHSVAYKGIAIACKRSTLTCKKNIVHSTLMSVTMEKIATTKTVAISRKKSLLIAECRTTSAQSLRRAKLMVGLVVVELALGDEVFGELGQNLEKDVLDFFGLLIIISLIHGSVRS